MKNIVQNAKKRLKLSLVRREVKSQIEDAMMKLSFYGISYALFLFIDENNVEYWKNYCEKVRERFDSSLDIIPIIIITHEKDIMQISFSEFLQIYEELVDECNDCHEEFQTLTTSEIAFIDDKLLFGNLKEKSSRCSPELNNSNIRYLYLDWNNDLFSKYNKEGIDNNDDGGCISSK